MAVTTWRAILVAVLSGLIALMGWTLSSVADMPKEYTTKEEYNQLRKENREDHKEIKRLILDIYKQKGDE